MPVCVSGLNISLCPLYLAEISPKNIRGAIGTCHQLAITIGILCSQIMGLHELLGKHAGCISEEPTTATNPCP